MIFAWLFLAVCLMWFSALTLLRHSPVVEGRFFFATPMLVWSGVLVALVASRPVAYPSDMALYLTNLRESGGEDWATFLASPKRDSGYSVFVWVLAHAGVNEVVFKTVIVIMLLAVCAAASLLLVPKAQAAVVFFGCTISPVFASYSTNAVRQGLALGLVALAVGFSSPRGPESGRSRWRSLVFIPLAIAPLFHLSALGPALIIAVVHLRPIRLRTALLIWVAGAALFVTGLNATLLQRLVEMSQRGQAYLSQGVFDVNYYRGGVNRLDFMLFGAALVGLAVVLCHESRARLPEVSEGPAVSLVLLSSYFLYFGFVTYSDRLASYSWFVAPIVIGYYVFAGSLDKARGFAYLALVIAVAFAHSGVPVLFDRVTS